MSVPILTKEVSARALGGLPSARAVLAAVTAAFDAASLYFGHGTDCAQDEAAWLVAHVLGIDYSAADWHTQFEQRLDHPPGIDFCARVAALAAQRIQTRKPLAYLIGEAWFAGHRFVVNESVLVPRSPIARLIGQHYAPWLADDARRVLDLCTGGGCIAIATALAMPQLQVDASDISPPALAVAKANIALHGVADRVRLIEADLFQSQQFAQYDLIVSNPPYVDRHEMATRAPEYRHEPTLGLASGDDGLDLTRQLLAQAARYLTESGVLIVEVGASDEALQRAYTDVPFIWLDFADNSRGVFVLGRDALLAHAERFGTVRVENSGER